MNQFFTEFIRALYDLVNFGISFTVSFYYSCLNISFIRLYYYSNYYYYLCYTCYSSQKLSPKIKNTDWFLSTNERIQCNTLITIRNFKFKANANHAFMFIRLGITLNGIIQFTHTCINLYTLTHHTHHHHHSC